MKKFCAVALAFVLALCTAAWAETQNTSTVITYSEPEVESYSVTIPSEAAISNVSMGDGMSFAITIVPSAGFNQDLTISVSLDANTLDSDGKLELTESTTGYTMHMKLKNSDGDYLANSAEVFSVNALGSDGEAISETISAEISDSTGDKIIGGLSYTGTLSFSISID